MSLEEWYDQLFDYATGWCGYTPDYALDTNIGLLERALTAKFDFLKKTNPWRTQKDIDEERLSERNPAKAQEGIVAWAMAMKGQKPDRKKNRVRQGVILPEGMEMPVYAPVKKSNDGN